MIVLFQHLDLPVEDVDGPVDVAFERLGPLGVNDRVGILSRRECDHARVHTSGKKQIRGPECRLQSGSVTIEQEVNPRRKTVKKGHLV